MREDVFLHSEAAKRLYAQVRDLPIVDYHCHLSPRELYEDKPFEDIGEMWLAGDHYKWRLMREWGVDERYITGRATWHEKFVKYAECIGLAVGNPLYHWTALELKTYFGIDEYLCAENAEHIYERANAVIRERRLSPRECLRMMKVELVVTTDDPAEPLEWHDKIAADPSFPCKVQPAFRADNAVNIRSENYRDYVAKLGDAAGVKIRDLDTLESALRARLDYFCDHGCRFADVGVEGFAGGDGDREEAAETFLRALHGKKVKKDRYENFLAYIYRFLAGEYAQWGMVSQLHLAAGRNTRTALLESCGVDAGGDIAADAISPRALARFFDSCEKAGGLPETIVYTLDASNAAALATASFTFPKVKPGAAWWFCDTLGGIRRQLEVVAETGHLAIFPGMLTDSRSFLSYPRHDFFRRIAADLLGEWVEDGTAAEHACSEVMYRICYENSANMAKINE